MDNIIDSLIEIEKRSQELNEKANNDLNNLQALIAEKKKQLISDAEALRNEEIKAIENHVEDNIRHGKEAIEKEKQELLQKMLEEYNKNHAKWEQDIYNSVIKKD